MAANEVETTPIRRAAKIGHGAPLELEAALDGVLTRLTGTQAPAVVGRYRLGRRLGAGACGAVFEAEDPSLQRKVAVKVVLPAHVGRGDATEQARLLREARALAKLGHANVVEIYDVGVEERSDGVFVVMERIDGPTLRDWIRDEPRPGPEAVVRAFAAAARGLAAAHAVGVVHRDFKPANAMIGADGRVRVLDFGLAREGEAVSSDADPPRSVETSDGSLTRTGFVMGTPRYMAPEQHAAEPASPAADQYALCVSLWEALTGTPPFVGETMADIVAMKRDGPPPRPASIPPAIDAVLRRGMDPDPGARWRDLNEVATALERAVERRPVRRWPWAVALVGVAAGAAFLAAPTDAVPAICEAGDPGGPWRARFDEVQSHTVPGEDLLAETSAKVPGRLERFATDFAEARERLCTGDLVGQERTRRADCLQRARQRFDGILGATDELEPRHLARRVLAIEIPGRCLGEEAEPLFVRTPSEEVELDGLYDLSRNVDEHPNPDELDAELAAAGERARELRDTFTYIALLGARDLLAYDKGEDEAIVQRRQEAVRAAEAAQDLVLVSEQMPILVKTMRAAGAPRAEIDEALGRADEALDRAGRPPFSVLLLESVRTHVLVQRDLQTDVLASVARGEAAAEALPPAATEDTLAGMRLYAGIAHWRLGETDVAIEILDDLVERTDPKSLRGAQIGGGAYRILGLIADERGDHAGQLRAIQGYRDRIAAAFPPDHPQVWYADAEYGRELVFHGEVEDGLARITTAYHRFADNQGQQQQRLAYVSNWGVDAALAAGKADLALSFARDFLEYATGPETDGVFSEETAHGLLAAAHLLADDVDAAAAELAKAPKLRDKGSSEAILTHARVALAQGRPPEAVEDALRVLGMWPTLDLSVMAYSFRADAYLVLADAARAQGHGEDAVVYEGLARPQLARGDYWHRRRLAPGA